jgi:aspartate aminotransferase
LPPPEFLSNVWPHASPRPIPQPPTVIFHLTARYRADTFKDKLNLGVGAYRDEELKPVVFSAVRKAEAAVLAANNDKEYLPIAGLPDFRVRVEPPRVPCARACSGSKQQRR